MSRASLARTYRESLIALTKEYLAENEGKPFRKPDVVAWVIATGRWKQRRRSPEKELSRDLGKALDHAHEKDPQGRKVRSFHAAKFTRIASTGQKIFDVVWDYIFSMSMDHARVSLNQRWEQHAKGLRALDTDRRSINDNNPNAATEKIQMTFDFTFVVEPQREQIVEQIAPDAPDHGMVDTLKSKKPR